MAETFFFEQKACRQFDTVISVSKQDHDTFRTLYKLDNIAIIPTGVDIEYFRPQDVPTESSSLVFVGSMDWLPNEEAVLYFADQVLPLLKNELPDIHLCVVGRNPSPRLKKRLSTIPEIRLTGWVDDVRPDIAKAAIYIVPIRIGGGTRMKIYEAMAMGKAILSTSIGAEGLIVQDGENIILEDEPLAFSQKIILMEKDPKMRIRLGEHASKFVRENCTWPTIGDVFHQICHATVQADRMTRKSSESSD